MKFSPQSNVVELKDILPLHSVNKFARTISIPREKLEALASHPKSNYDPFLKKTGNKERMIDNPKEFLKQVQRRINKCIFGKYPMPPCIVGGVTGKKPEEHLVLHVRKPVVITLDIKDCFPSITNKNVYEMWRKRFVCSPSVARLATKLVTHEGHLPLGAPTSNMIANFIILNAVERFEKAVEIEGLDFSQYVDDSALSGSRFSNKIISILAQELAKEGLKVNRKKIGIMRSNRAQRVTKRNVNRKISLPKNERNRVRAALHELKVRTLSASDYRKKYSSVKGRVESLRKYHPRLAERMLDDMGRIKDSRGK